MIVYTLQKQADTISQIRNYVFKILDHCICRESSSGGIESLSANGDYLSGFFSRKYQHEFEFECRQRILK